MSDHEQTKKGDHRLTSCQAVLAYGVWLVYLTIWFCRPQTGIKQAFGRSKTKHKVPPRAKQSLIIEAAIGIISIIIVLGVVGGGVAGLEKGIKGELGRGSLLYVRTLHSDSPVLTLHSGSLAHWRLALCR